MKKPKKGNAQRARRRAAKRVHARAKSSGRHQHRVDGDMANGMEHLTFAHDAVAKLVDRAKAEGHKHLYFADDRRTGPGAYMLLATDAGDHWDG